MAKPKRHKLRAALETMLLLSTAKLANAKTAWDRKHYTKDVSIVREQLDNI